MSFHHWSAVAASMFAIVVGSSAWGDMTPNRSLDEAFLISEALRATSVIGPAPFPILSSGPAPSRAASPGTAPKKLSQQDLRVLQALANNADIKLKIAAAWAASNPKSSDRAERGFWICRDRETGELYTRPFASADGPRYLIPGAPSIDAIAFFHTHPFPGVPQGPSVEDEQFADLSNMPGIIRSRAGLHYFGPGLKLWQPR